MPQFLSKFRVLLRPADRALVGREPSTSSNSPAATAASGHFRTTRDLGGLALRYHREPTDPSTRLGEFGLLWGDRPK